MGLHKAGWCDPSPGQPCSAMVGLFQAHAVRIKGHCRRPVGENPEDADLGQRVQCDQDVPVVIESVKRRLIVERRARGTLGRQHFFDDTPRPLERPGDDVEPSGRGRQARL